MHGMMQEMMKEEKPGEVPSGSMKGMEGMMGRMMKMMDQCGSMMESAHGESGKAKEREEKK